MTDVIETEHIPVPRSRIFVMADGKFVVQWEEKRVQDLLSGRYHTYDMTHSVSPISNFELNQLQSIGVVQAYTDDMVYISSQPVAGRSPARTYYLNTTLPKSMKNEVSRALLELHLSERFSVRIQQTFIIVRGPGGIPFMGYDAAEKAREQLVVELPHLFRDTIIAFVEIVDVS